MSGYVVGNVKGNEGNDDRRSPRRSWCGSTTQLQRDRRTRVVGWRRGHCMGRHVDVDIWRTLFGTFWQRTRDVKIVADLCSWTRPNVSKPAHRPYRGRREREHSRLSPPIVPPQEVSEVDRHE